MEFDPQKKNIILVVLVMTVACLVLTGVFGVFVWYFFSGGSADVTTDVSQYGQFDDFMGYSRLYIFPDNLPPSTSDVSYFYSCRDTFLDPTCQVYLECEYSEEDYRAEVERLSQLQESYQSRVNSVYYDEEHFSLPAWVAVYRFNHTYEYALLLEKSHRIVYVFTQFIDKDDVVFPQIYLPADFSTETGDAMSGFSLYAFPIEDNSGFYMTY